MSAESARRPNCRLNQPTMAPKRKRTADGPESLTFLCCECGNEIKWSENSHGLNEFTLRYGGRGKRTKFVYHDACKDKFFAGLKERHRKLLADSKTADAKKKQQEAADAKKKQQAAIAKKQPQKTK